MLLESLKITVLGALLIVFGFLVGPLTGAFFFMLAWNWSIPVFFAGLVDSGILPKSIGFFASFGILVLLEFTVFKLFKKSSNKVE